MNLKQNIFGSYEVAFILVLNVSKDGLCRWRWW